MTDLDSYDHDEIDNDEISRMIDDLFAEADERPVATVRSFGWDAPESVAPAPAPVVDPADAERRRAVRAFGHQIRLTRRAAGYRTTGELAFAMRTLGIKITGATIGNWERGFILPDPRALRLAEQVMGTEGALLDSLHELIGNDEAEIEPESVDGGPDVHTRLRIEDLETRVADLEDEVEDLRAAATRRTEPRTVAGPTQASTRGWLARLRTAPTHHHTAGPSAHPPHRDPR